MTPSNVWALIVGLLLVGGTVIGGVVWRQSHPDSPELARLVAPLMPHAKAPAPPPPSQAAQSPAPETEVPKAEVPKSEASRTEAPKIEALPPAAPDAKKSEAKPEGPKFDIVRVEPSGDSVVAGQSDPNANVALVEGGKVVSETKADPTGHFVMLPPPLKPGDHDLSLRQSDGTKPASDSKQNVAVSIPRKSSGQVVVALAEPGKPTKVLSAPPEAERMPPPPPVAEKPLGSREVAIAKPETKVAPPAAIAPKGPDLAIRTVELENGNGFYATGVGIPGTQIEIYLNGAHLAGVVSGPDGQWSVTIKKGLAGGHYAVRADAIGQGRKVTARVEVPFDVPPAMAEAPKPKPATSPAPKVAAAKKASPATKVAAASARPSVAGPQPYAAPSPSEVAGLGPDPSLAGPGPQSDIKPIVPAPRADIAAAAKATTQAAPRKAPPTLAMAPPAASSLPNAVPAPAPPAAARAPQPAPAKMAVSPPKPADAPPMIASTKPSIAPPKRAEVAVAVGAKPAPAAAPPATASAAPPAAVPPAAEAPAPPSPSVNAANAVIEEVETSLVIRGDNLWNISRARLGNATRYTQIYAANSDQIRNPNLIYPGQVFVMPQK